MATTSMAFAHLTDSPPRAGPSRPPSSAMRSSSRPIASRNPFLDSEGMARASQELPASSSSNSISSSNASPFSNLPYLAFGTPQHTGSTVMGSPARAPEEGAGSADTVMDDRVGIQETGGPGVEDLRQAFSIASISQRNSSMPISPAPSPRTRLTTLEEADPRGQTVPAPGTPPQRNSSMAISPAPSPRTRLTTLDEVSPQGQAAPVVVPATPPQLPPRRDRSRSSDRLHSNRDASPGMVEPSSSSSEELEEASRSRIPSYSISTNSPLAGGSVSSQIPMVPGTDYPEPTITPTPGRPLLRDGKLMLMPPSWESCSKCKWQCEARFHE
ncbi:hypothetical protein BCV69DRAFT_15594 [Microstroma glucosiphilum]|uniref:Uncharacterized protein n=1 Tax=Pseudomicrostroma glucosiphilum TaxID=1684307 RepID=A0A316UF75_9BASI|nr:hypothetical protein BCV69DRAFT_15594 [Pseudomicrostroma glucosiphilum]PWN23967.1 hypothetical protein BCV69DRAFT_15594 [Pseudomicrostroma glucosiphilum]